MMQFQLRVQASGSTSAQSITIDAASEADAIRSAVKNGWRVLAIDSPPAQASASGRRGAQAEFPLLQFSQELMALLEAGLNLTEAITTLHNKENRAAIKQVIGGILLALQQGKSYSDTLQDYPAIFSDIYISTMRAAERSGSLPEALSRFIAYQLQFDSIKKKLVSAAIYPCMLLSVGTLVTLFLLGYVVPRFSVVYESAGRDIPWMSQVLLGFGKAIAGHTTVFLLVLAGSIGALVAMAMHAPTRARLLLALLRLPVLAAKAAEFRLARFYRALSLLLQAGIPLAKGLAMVAPMLLPAQQQALAQARRLVEEGQPFSSALEQYGLTTPVAQSLLKVGENTGRLGDMLERSAKFHDEEFARWVDWASRLLEPMLMAIMGVVIGGVVVLMYMPIFELAGSLS
jgi:general secretion pathway protein F